MTPSTHDSLMRCDYAETIEALLLRDRRNQAARTWKAIALGTGLTVLGCLCAEGAPVYDEPLLTANYAGGER